MADHTLDTYFCNLEFLSRSLAFSDSSFLYILRSTKLSGLSSDDSGIIPKLISPPRFPAHTSLTIFFIFIKCRFYAIKKNIQCNYPKHWIWYFRTSTYTNNTPKYSFNICYITIPHYSVTSESAIRTLIWSPPQRVSAILRSLCSSW